MKVKFNFKNSTYKNVSRAMLTSIVLIMIVLITSYEIRGMSRRKNDTNYVETNIELNGDFSAEDGVLSEDYKLQKEIPKNNENQKKREFENIDEYKNYIFQNVNEIISKYLVSDNIAVSFTDLTAGVYIGYNDETVFTAASTTKLPFALLICQYLESGQLSLEDTYAYYSSYYEDGAGVMFDSYNGEEFTIETLLYNMLVYSDNIAANVLYENLGFTNSRQAMGEMLGVDIDSYDNTMTTYEMNEALKLLYYNKDKEYYSYVLDLLTNTIFHDRLDKYLPHELVAHKIGNYEGNSHDVALVLTDKPYAITVYTDGVEDSYEIMANLNKEIYDLYASLN